MTGSHGGADDGLFLLADDADAARASAERLFAAVEEELSSTLPPSAEIVHVGATAVPGCLGKGDLDVAVRVDAADFAGADARLAARFARNAGSVRTAGFAAFEDPHRTPHLGIQLAIRGGSLDVFHTFAEALRRDRQLLQRYNALKRAWHGRPMAEYRVAKGDFVLGVLRSAGPLRPVR